MQIDTQQLPRKCDLARQNERSHGGRGDATICGGGENVGETAIREGHHIFTNELRRLAQRSCDSRISELVDGLRGPLRVAVRGRDGVGRATAAAALAQAGLTVTDGADADITVVVVAEALKPEDRAMVAAPGPTLVVLNKADLAGFGAGGPIAVADRRAADLQARTGVPTVPMVALLAVASVDDELIAALRVLAAEPCDLTTTDGFVSAEHSLPRGVRERLLATLDLFGIAHAVLALGQGTPAEALEATLRRLSQVDRVMSRLTAVGAEVRYQRTRSALVSLRALAAAGAPAVAEYLSGDEPVLALMAAAVDVVEAAGLPVDDADHRSAHLQRAVVWNRYSRGPVNRLHQHCGLDICRGSLRLMQRAAL